ncbi:MULTISPECIES: ScbR family autoregulator-binding transcription factor [Streptomyces]|uniref:ScbR family autoregulator-binding transcription factor n=1 Tax=Streptomyces TaxID=1883 RepID=UPI0023B16C0D|nr:ScbR family autoregulator-binding transcription factor [Streptomyces sp. KA12]MDF0376173.1 TetR/AcrR family transcriptional regulator [Streptomyces sp. KA12]
MSPRELKQERSARTRAAILRAGAEMFAEAGFAGASVSGIARRADLTLGALYFHFQSKEELAREIVRAQPTQVPVAPDARGLQAAVDTSVLWATRLLEDPVLLAGARLVMDQEYFVDPHELNSYQQWVEVLLPFLREAAEHGDLRDEVAPEALARLVVNAATGLQMNEQLSTGRRHLPDRVREMWQFLLPLITTGKSTVCIAEPLRPSGT